MPKFLERKLKQEYPNNPHAVYGTMNSIGAMVGNKGTAKGRAMEAKHERDHPPKKRLHPALAERARMVKEAHQHLAAKIPGFHQLPARQRMIASQEHVRQRKANGY